MAKKKSPKKSSSKSNVAEPATQASPVLVGLLILSLIVTIVGGGYLLLSPQDGGGPGIIQIGQPGSSGEPSSDQPQAGDPSQQVPETEKPPIASGRQVYSIASKAAGPNFTELVVDPLNATVGQSQTTTIKLSHPGGVKSVKVLLITDGEPVEHQLAKVGDDDSGEIWEGTWQMPSTYNTTYGMTLSAVGNDGVETSPKIEVFYR